MKKIALLLIPILIWACNTTSKYSPEKTLNQTQQEDFKYDIIRFVGKLAKRSNHETKFNKEFDEPYKRSAQNMLLDKYYVNEKDGYIYFEVSRIAPSNEVKYVATGGRLKRDDSGKIVDYEEIYRTWKMSKEELEKKTATYFDYMVNQKDLSRFYTVNIGNTENIEFPDAQSKFNKDLRRWEYQLPDSLLKY